MNADSPWGEVRWQEPHPSSSAHDTSMTMKTLLATDRPLGVEYHEDRHARHMDTYQRIDHRHHVSQANLNIGEQSNESDRSGMLSKYLPNALINHSHRRQSPAILSSFDHLDKARTGVILEQKHQHLDSGRRLSGLQQNLDRRTPNDLSTIHTSGRVSPPPLTSLLPSFASLQQSTNCNDLQDDNPRTVPKETPTCRGCIEKKTVIDDIATAVTSLDELISNRNSRPSKRRPERPQNCSLRTARWVLDCVRDARMTLQDYSPSHYLGHNAHQQAYRVESPIARLLSPSGTKRRPEGVDRDEGPSIKRQRTASYHESRLDQYHVVGDIEEQRRASESMQRNEPFRTYSPTLSDSWTNSAHNQQRSPSIYGRSLRPLPSPASLGTAPQKAGWSGLSAPSESSPTSVNPISASIHTASTSSAASQHIADLQHQVTLKSLALQTLQTEYTSLLQKFQRDRLKSQTFEKKTVAADQEINDLTTRNEELVEQVRTLDAQVEECDRKRESERSAASREKDQWGKMLDMSGRLQAKNTDERQKLVQERDDLQQRLSFYENEAALSAKRNPPHTSKAKTSAGQHDGSSQVNDRTDEIPDQHATQDAVLQRELETWQKRTYLLRSVLERIHHQSASFVEKRRQLMEQEVLCIPNTIQMALREDSAFAKPLELETDRTGRRKSFGLSPPQVHSSLSKTSVDETSANQLLSSPMLTTLGSNAAVPPIVSEDEFESRKTLPKSSTRQKLQSVPLPKWQPPSTPPLRTDLLGNSQRRPSGPATPFPSSEPSQRQLTGPVASQKASLGAKTSPPPVTPLPVIGKEKSPARNYSPQYVDLSPAIVKGTADLKRRLSPAAAMPPPPRPGADPAAAASTTASWRPS